MDSGPISRHPVNMLHVVLCPTSIVDEFYSSTRTVKGLEEQTSTQQLNTVVTRITHLLEMKQELVLEMVLGVDNLRNVCIPGVQSYPSYPMEY